MKLELVSAGGLRLAVWEWPGAGPPLLFAHATGFHGRMWDHIIRASHRVHPQSLAGAQQEASLWKKARDCWALRSH